MSVIASLTLARLAAGRGFPIVRQQYRLGDKVRVKATGAVGAFDRYEADGKVRLFIRGGLAVFDQASVEPAGGAVDIPIIRKEGSR